MKKIALLSIILLAGCAASQKEIIQKLSVKGPKSKARLEFHRPNRFVSGGVSADIKANGRKIASISNGNAEVAFIRPGKTTLKAGYWLSFGDSTHTFYAKAGRTYKFRVAPRGINIHSGPSVSPRAGTTDKRGNRSEGYFSIRPMR